MAGDRGGGSIASWFESAAVFTPLQGLAHLVTVTGSGCGCQGPGVTEGEAEVQRGCVLEHLVWDTEEGCQDHVWDEQCRRADHFHSVTFPCTDVRSQ